VRGVKAEKKEPGENWEGPLKDPKHNSRGEQGKKEFAGENLRSQLHGKKPNGIQEKNPGRARKKNAGMGLTKEGNSRKTKNFSLSIDQ